MKLAKLGHRRASPGGSSPPALYPRPDERISDLGQNNTPSDINPSIDAADSEHPWALTTSLLQLTVNPSSLILLAPFDLVRVDRFGSHC
ncbi:hypothetical protein PtB15_9B137 [Puccinia triticina]|nr:hypothetical protein PtB15_9B137 [Puccinia triticina]